MPASGAGPPGPASTSPSGKWATRQAACSRLCVDGMGWGIHFLEF